MVLPNSYSQFLNIIGIYPHSTKKCAVHTDPERQWVEAQVDTLR